MFNVKKMLGPSFDKKRGLTYFFTIGPYKSIRSPKNTNFSHFTEMVDAFKNMDKIEKEQY